MSLRAVPEPELVLVRVLESEQAPGPGLGQEPGLVPELGQELEPGPELGQEQEPRTLWPPG
jgi:hypothetical protein